jgi:hypothetical protein
MHYAVICWDKDGSAELRRACLDAHRDYVDAHASALLVSGALLAEDGETRVGQLFVLDVPDRTDAESFVASDPLTASGVFRDVAITGMAVKFRGGKRISGGEVAP